MNRRRPERATTLLVALAVVASAGRFVGATPPDPAVQCVVSGNQVFAVSSPRVVTLGKARLISWSPSETAVAVSFAPVIETPLAEATRLKRGEISNASAFASLVVYTLEAGKTVRIAPAWDTNFENDERLGWIDDSTLVIATTPRKPESGERLRMYLADTGSGSIVSTIQSPLSIVGSGPCYSSGKGGVAQVLLADLSSGGPNSPMSLHVLSRAGLSDPMLTAGMILGGAASLDRSGIIWSVDGKQASYRWSNGRLQSSPVTDDEIAAVNQRERARAHDDEFRTGELKLSVQPLSPTGRIVMLKASHPVPLQPDEMVVGLAGSINPSGGLSIGDAGLIYELDGVIFARFIVELKGPAAAKALDQAEQVTLERWGKLVISEYRSWTYGLSGSPDPTKFPAAQMTSFKEFSARLKWLGSRPRLFQINGERFVASFTDSGDATFEKVK